MTIPAEASNVSDGRFDCFDPVIDLRPRWGRVARDESIIGGVSAIYREPAGLFKDKWIFKPPGARGCALHQEYISWNALPSGFATLIVALNSSDAGNGATGVSPGFHQCDCLTTRDGMDHYAEYGKMNISFADNDPVQG